jgi:hypothetical protein
MAAISITAPNPGFTGTRAGVAFEDGRGEVDADDAVALAYFARHGYAIGTLPAAPRKERPGASKNSPTTASKGASPHA